MNRKSFQKHKRLQLSNTFNALRSWEDNKPQDIVQSKGISKRWEHGAAQPMRVSCAACSTIGNTYRIPRSIPYIRYPIRPPRRESAASPALATNLKDGSISPQSRVLDRELDISYEPKNSKFPRENANESEWDSIIRPKEARLETAIEGLNRILRRKSKDFGEKSVSQVESSCSTTINARESKGVSINRPELTGMKTIKRGFIRSLRNECKSFGKQSISQVESSGSTRSDSTMERRMITTVLKTHSRPPSRRSVEKRYRKDLQKLHVDHKGSRPVSRMESSSCSTRSDWIMDSKSQNNDEVVLLSDSPRPLSRCSIDPYGKDLKLKVELEGKGLQSDGVNGSPSCNNIVNQRFKDLKLRVEIFPTASRKGFGLRIVQCVPKGVGQEAMNNITSRPESELF